MSELPRALYLSVLIVSMVSEVSFELRNLFAYFLEVLRHFADFSFELVFFAFVYVIF